MKKFSNVWKATTPYKTPLNVEIWSFPEKNFGYNIIRLSHLLRTSPRAIYDIIIMSMLITLK